MILFIGDGEEKMDTSAKVVEAAVEHAGKGTVEITADQTTENTVDRKGKEHFRKRN